MTRTIAPSTSAAPPRARPPSVDEGLAEWIRDIEDYVAQLCADLIDPRSEHADPEAVDVRVWSERHDSDPIKRRDGEPSARPGPTLLVYVDAGEHRHVCLGINGRGASSIETLAGIFAFRLDPRYPYRNVRVSFVRD